MGLLEVVRGQPRLSYHCQPRWKPEKREARWGTGGYQRLCCQLHLKIEGKMKQFTNKYRKIYKTGAKAVMLIGMRGEHQTPSSRFETSLDNGVAALLVLQRPLAASSPSPSPSLPLPSKLGSGEVISAGHPVAYEGSLSLSSPFLHLFLFLSLILPQPSLYISSAWYRMARGHTELYHQPTGPDPITVIANIAIYHQQWET